MAPVWWYLLGIATPFAIAGAGAFLFWSLGPGFGSEGCYVCAHGARAEIGQHRAITMWIWSRWHRYFWASRKWHRAAWATHKWNPKNSRWR